MDCILILPKGLKVLKERWRGFFSPPVWEVEQLPASPSTANHCGAHFPKDYCHWSLPFGQSWHHSYCPWLQWLAGQRGGNRHSHSNPPFSYLRAQRVFSPPITPLTSSRFLLFLSVLSPMPVTCTTGPFSLPLHPSPSPSDAWIGHSVLKWCTVAWMISKGSDVTFETCECV